MVADTGKRTAMTAFQRAAQDPHTLQLYENVLEGWIGELEIMLGPDIGMLASSPWHTSATSSSQGNGPLSELEHWAVRVARLSETLDELKRPECRIVLGVAIAAKSKKLVKRWKAIDQQLTEHANAARDNLKYLEALHGHLALFESPSTTPTLLNQALTAFMQALRKMHQSSNHSYNNPKHMAALLSRVNDQIVLSCKQHLRNILHTTAMTQSQSAWGPESTSSDSHSSNHSNNSSLWNLHIPTLLSELTAIDKLYTHYRDTFLTMRERLRNQGKSLFNFPEGTKMFEDGDGPLDAFASRCAQLFGILDSYRRHTVLLQNIGSLYGTQALTQCI
jgi:hypothetical protein